MSNETLHHVSWENAAFSYDHTKPYASHVNVSIGQMIAICQHCHAKKWPGESAGMCCSGGKVEYEVDAFGRNCLVICQQFFCFSNCMNFLPEQPFEIVSFLFENTFVEILGTTLCNFLLLI